MDSQVGELVAARYARAFDVVVVCLVAAWHVGPELAAMLAGELTAGQRSAQVAAWLLFAAGGAAAGYRLLVGGTADRPPWPLLALLLATSALGTAGVPARSLATSANWVWDATGWFAVLLLLRRPLRELAAVLAVNSGFTVAAMVSAGTLDRFTTARFAMMAYATVALQLAVVLAARALDATARRAAGLADAEAAARRRQLVADALHASRRERYAAVSASTAPLLADLAAGRLDPGDRHTQHRCAVEASRLRRLFAETDDVPDPLLHELRACADIADRRGVLVDVYLVGRLPTLPVAVRRALTDAPLHALAAATRQARVTVVGRPDEVAVGVVADGSAEPVPAGPDPSPLCPPAPDPSGLGVTVTTQEGGDRRWVQTRWRRR